MTALNLYFQPINILIDAKIKRIKGKYIQFPGKTFTHSNP